MQKIKIAAIAALLVLSALSVVLLPVAVILLTPPAYSHTFVGALDEKVERLASIEGKKAVVIGGSSVAFGIDSALMEEHLGMPVVNFGLYAAIGTKAMLDLAWPHIGAGDTVISKVCVSRILCVPVTMGDITLLSVPNTNVGQNMIHSPRAKGRRSGKTSIGSALANDCHTR